MQEDVTIRVGADTTSMDRALRQAAGAIRGFGTAAQGQGKSIERSFLNMGNAVRGGIAAIAGNYIVQGIDKLIQLGSQATKTEFAFKSMAESSRANSQELLNSMTQATKGLVDDTDLMRSALFAMTQDIDPDKIPKIMETARTAARLTGRDLGEVTDTMIRGISMNMPRALRMMGMVTKEQMSILDKAMRAGIDDVKLLDIVLSNAARASAKMGPNVDTAGDSLKRLKIGVHNAYEEFAKWFSLMVSKDVALITSTFDWWVVDLTKTAALMKETVGYWKETFGMKPEVGVSGTGKVGAPIAGSKEMYAYQKSQGESSKFGWRLKEGLGEDVRGINIRLEAAKALEKERAITEELRKVKQEGLLEQEDIDRMMAKAPSYSGMAGETDVEKEKSWERALTLWGEWVALLKEVAKESKAAQLSISPFAMETGAGEEAVNKKIEELKQAQYEGTIELSEKEKKVTSTDLEYKLWSIEQEKMALLLKYGFDKDLVDRINQYTIDSGNRERALTDQSTRESLDHRLKMMTEQGSSIKEIQAATWEWQKKYTDDWLLGWDIGLEEFLDRYKTATEKAAEYSKQIADSMTGNITDSFMAMIEGTKTVGEAFHDMVKSILLDLARMAIQEQVREMVKGALSGIGAGIGKVTGNTSGGLVNNIVSGIGGLLTFQEGGLVPGLSGKAVPAIVHGGELVIPEDETDRYQQLASRMQFMGLGGGNIGKLTKQQREQLYAQLGITGQGLGSEGTSSIYGGGVGGFPSTGGGGLIGGGPEGSNIGPNSGQMAGMPSAVDTGLISASTGYNMEAAVANMLGFVPDSKGGFIPSSTMPLSVLSTIMAPITALTKAAWNAIMGNNNMMSIESQMSIPQAMSILQGEAAYGAPNSEAANMALGQQGPMSGGLEGYGSEGPGPAGNMGGDAGFGGSVTGEGMAGVMGGGSGIAGTAIGGDVGFGGDVGGDYDEGGVVTKLGPRQVPIIAEEGETVLPRGTAGAVVENHYHFEGATFLDQATLARSMETIAARVAPGAVIANYQNDGRIRSIIRSRR